MVLQEFKVGDLIDMDFGDHMEQHKIQKVEGDEVTILDVDTNKTQVYKKSSLMEDYTRYGVNLWKDAPKEAGSGTRRTFIEIEDDDGVAAIVILVLFLCLASNLD